MLEAHDYQKTAHTFVQGGSDCAEYALHGLVEEVGEVLGKFAKYKRKYYFTPRPKSKLYDTGLFTVRHLRDADRRFLKDIGAELGDCCWMLAELCTQYGLRLDRIMERNIKKLTDRQARGVIVGSGDNR